MKKDNEIEEIIRKYDSKYIKTLKWEQGELQAIIFEPTE